jgi:N-acetylglucosaminyldiphosphoundecaprenol N-acetyl-beta-D-mannosaminyltransferase
MREIERFGIKIHPLPKTEFLSKILSGLESGTQIVQNGVNAASIIELVNNDILRNAINNSNLVNIDGISVLMALRFLGYQVPERVACPDLAADILALAELKKYSVFLFGAKEESLQLSVKKLHDQYPGLRIAGSRNGYFTADDELAIVEMINNSDSDILFLGMPSPHKELFVEKYKDTLKVKYFLGVGGFFDILSGLTKRAPLWVQNIGMEWLFRFAQEPHRMWRRYIIGNTRFICLILREKLKRNNG